MESAITCASCETSLAADDPMCLNCGTPARAERRLYPSIGGWILGRPGKPSIKKSANWLLTLSMIFLVLGTLQGKHHYSEARQALQSLEPYDDAEIFEVEGELITVGTLEAEIKRDVWFVFGFNYLLAAVMLGLYFRARRDPYRAMFLGLAIYIGLIAVGAIYEPDSLYRGLFIKLPIIFGLMFGIFAARAERAEAARLPHASIS